MLSHVWNRTALGARCSRISFPLLCKFSTSTNKQSEFSKVRESQQAQHEQQTQSTVAPKSSFPVKLSAESSMLEKLVFQYMSYARERLELKQRAADLAKLKAEAELAAKLKAPHAPAQTVVVPATPAAAESAPAKPKTLKEALLAPYIWLLDLAIDKQIEQAMIERDAWSLYDMLCHSSKNTSLQTALGLPETFRTYLSLWSVHLFICINEMQLNRRTSSAARGVSIIFTKFKDDFTREVKARGVKMAHKYFSTNDDILQAAHRQWSIDLKVPEEQRFAHLLASVWVYVYVAGVHPSELADSAKREHLIAGARLLTKYILENAKLTQAMDAQMFFSGKFAFAALPKLSKSERIIDLDDNLVKQRKLLQAPFNV